MSFLATVALVWGIAAVTPGPNFIAVTRCALTGDRKAAVASVAGIVLGTTIWGLCGWLGISALFAAAPAAYLVLKLAGGIYICWVGGRMLFGAIRHRNDLQNGTPAKPMSMRRAFSLGVMTNLANPKTAIFVTSIFAAALPQAYHWSHGLMSVGVMVGISTTWYLTVAFAFSGRHIGGVYRRAKRAIDGITGTIFLGFGLKLLASQR